jgi:adenylate kinase
MHLIFIGYPGSGKGTVAKQLASTHTQISTGDLLRAEIASGSKLGKEIDAVISGGNLVNDDMALALIQANFDPTKNYIFDGFPRTLKQAQMLNDLVLKGHDFKAIYFKIDKELLTDRIIHRRSCPKCGAIYNVKFKAPQVPDTCDTCGTKGLTHRKDDTIEVLSTRLAVFEKTGPEILDFYKDCLVTVDGSAEAQEIIKAITK